MAYSTSNITISKYKIATRKWDLDNPIGSICLVHGIGEHSARYAHWAERFNKAGYSFYTLDLPGHGESSGKRGHIDHFKTIMNLVQKLLETAEADHPDKPIILYGHSMGGLIVTRYLLSNLKLPAKSVVTSPWLGLTVKPASFLIGLAYFIRRIYPGFVQKTEVEHKFISHDQVEVDKYKNDPLIHYKVSVNMLVSMLTAIEYNFHHADKLQTDLLMLHGSDDMITSPEASEKFAIKNKEKTEFILMPGLFHEMHHEPNKDELFEIIINWINKN